MLEVSVVQLHHVSVQLALPAAFHPSLSAGVNVLSPATAYSLPYKSENIQLQDDPLSTDKNT